MTQTPGGTTWSQVATADRGAGYGVQFKVLSSGATVVGREVEVPWNRRIAPGGSASFGSCSNR